MTLYQFCSFDTRWKICGVEECPSSTGGKTTEGLLKQKCFGDGITPRGGVDVTFHRILISKTRKAVHCDFEAAREILYHGLKKKTKQPTQSYRHSAVAVAVQKVMHSPAVVFICRIIIEVAGRIKTSQRSWIHERKRKRGRGADLVGSWREQRAGVMCTWVASPRARGGGSGR